EFFPDEFIAYLLDDETLLHAHNATFERLGLEAYEFYPKPSKWRCTMIKSAYCGLPMGLGEVAKVLGLPIEKDKLGKELIRFFCMPQKRCKANNFTDRNLPGQYPEKWKAFMQ